MFTSINSFIKSASLLIAGLFLQPLLAGAQTFQQFYTQNVNVEFRSVLPVSGGDYIVFGAANSQLSSNKDFFVARMDPSGKVVWQFTYGGSGNEQAYTAVEKTNGNIVLAGSTTGFVAGGIQDILLVEISSSDGSLVWSHTYGSASLEEFPTKINLSPNGLLICGYSYPPGNNSPDCLVFELSPDGTNIHWQNLIDSGSGDIPGSIIPSRSGGYILVGGSNVSAYDQGIFRLNNQGKIISHLGLGSNDNELATDVVELPNNDLIVMGNFRMLSGAGLEMSLMSVSPTNTLNWVKTYGDKSIGDERAFAFTETNDGYAFAGYSSVFGLGANEGLLIRTDKQGNMLSSTGFGDINADILYGLLQNADHTFTLAGLSTAAGTASALLVKTDVNGNIKNNCSSAPAIENIVNPSTYSKVFTENDPALINTPVVVTKALGSIISVPPVVILTKADSICEGTQVKLDTLIKQSAGYKLQFFEGTTLLTNTVVSPLKTSSYSVRATKGTCDTTIALKIRVVEKPSYNVVSPVPVCGLTVVDLTATWSELNHLPTTATYFTSNGQSVADPTSVSDSGSYTLHLNTPGCGAEDKLVKIAFAEGPEATLSVIKKIFCLDGTDAGTLKIKLSKPTVPDYELKLTGSVEGPITKTFSSDSLLVSIAVSQEITFLSLKDKNGCEALLTGDKQIQMKGVPLPIASASIQTKAKERLCQDQAIALTSNTPDTSKMETGKWSSLPAHLIPATSLSSQNVLIDSLLPGDYTFIWKISNSVCPDDSSLVLLHIDQKPEPAMVLFTDSTFCQDPFVLPGVAIAIGEGEWQTVSGSLLFLDSSKKPDASVSIPPSSTVSLQWLSYGPDKANNTCAPKKSNLVTLQTLSTIRMDLIALEVNSQVCLGETPVELKAFVKDSSLMGNLSYTWLKNGDTLATTSTSSFTDLFPSYSNNYAVEIKTDSKCVKGGPFHIGPLFVVGGNLSVTLSSSDTTLCSGSSYEAKVEITHDFSPVSFAWYNHNGIQVPGSENSLQPHFTESGDYYLSVIDGVCSAKSTIPVKVNVLETPLVDAGPDLEIFPQNEGLVINGTTTGTDYHWTLLLPGMDSLDLVQTLPSAQVPAGEYTIELKAQNGTCQATDQAKVIMYPLIKIPNAFSPNNDGRNDVWVLDGIESFPSVHMYVYNRWGSLLYSSRGYASPWDGTVNGKEVASGTYYYILEIGEESKKVSTGSLTIVR